MTTFKKLNLSIGWITWIIASAVYLLTIEPTTSFWDCGEFIATAFKTRGWTSSWSTIFYDVSALFYAIRFS